MAGHGLAARSLEGLPDKAFLFLTEYVTWQLDGVAKTDDDVTRQRQEAFEYNQKKWWDHQGPGWLMKNLELIRDGKGWPPTKSGNTEIDDFNAATLSRATQWLRQSGLDVREALSEIENTLNQEIANSRTYDDLESLIWSESSSGQVKLWGRLWNESNRRPEPEYSEMPHRFFLRRARFFAGNGYHGKGELCRWPDDESEQGLMDSVFNKSDPPVTYVEIKISRNDALKLHARMASSAADDKLEKQQCQDRARAVLDREWWPWEVAVAHVMSAGDKEYVEAVAGRPDPWQLCTLDLITRAAAFKHFHDRDLELRFESPFFAWRELRAKIADSKIAIRGNALEGADVGGAAIPPEQAETLEPMEIRGTETWLCINGCLNGAQGAWRHAMVNRQQLLEHFPKAASAVGRVASTISAETKCIAELKELMATDPKNLAGCTNEKLKAMFPGLGKNALARAKAAAITSTGAIAWGAAGAPKKSPQP